jgi:hypothetical protein
MLKGKKNKMITMNDAERKENTNDSRIEYDMFIMQKMYREMVFDRFWCMLWVEMESRM